MVYAPVRSIIAKARGLSPRTGAQTMLYLSLRVILKLEFCLQALGEEEGAWLKLHFTGHEETPLNRACYFHFLCAFFTSEGFSIHNTFLCVFSMEFISFCLLLSDLT